MKKYKKSASQYIELIKSASSPGELISLWEEALNEEDIALIQAVHKETATLAIMAMKDETWQAQQENKRQEIENKHRAEEKELGVFALWDWKYWLEQAILKKGDLIAIDFSCVIEEYNSGEVTHMGTMMTLNEFSDFFQIQPEEEFGIKVCPILGAVTFDDKSMWFISGSLREKPKRIFYDNRRIRNVKFKIIQSIGE